MTERLHPLDRKALTDYYKGMIGVMVDGRGKGYSQQLSHMNGPLWQLGEITSKAMEIKRLRTQVSEALKAKDYQRAEHLTMKIERCLYKISCAAYTIKRDFIDYPPSAPWRGEGGSLA